MADIGSGLDLIRHLAVLGRPSIVLTHDQNAFALMGKVRESLAVAGRLDDLREVRLPGCDKRLPFEGQACRIDPAEGFPTMAWRDANPVVTKWNLDAARDCLLRDVPDHAALPTLTEEDATAAGRVVLVLGDREDHVGPYAFWLLQRGVERARAEGRPEPALLIGDVSDAFAKAALGLGFERFPSEGQYALGILATARWGDERAEWVRPDDAWHAAVRRNRERFPVRRGETLSWIGDGERTVVVADRPAYRRNSRTVIEILPGGRVRSRVNHKAADPADETLRAAWDGGIATLNPRRWEETPYSRHMSGLVLDACRVEEGGPADREAIDGMMRRVDVGLSNAIDAHPLNEPIFLALRADPAARGRRRDFVLTWPALAELVLREDVRAAVDVGAETTPFLAGLLGTTQPVVRRLVGVGEIPEAPRLRTRGSTGRIRASLAYLTAFGHDNLPASGDAEGWTALNWLSGWLGAFVLAQDGFDDAEAVRILTGIPGTGWKERRVRCARHVRGSDARDMTRGLAAWLTAVTGRNVDVGIATRVMLGHGPLHRIVEAAERWHEDGLLRGDGQGLPLSTCWPVPFEGVPLAGGFEARVLRSVRELIDEGMQGPDSNGLAGLHHCVGGYGRRCQTGESLIVSLRRAGEAGVERVSTAELVPWVDGDWTIAGRTYALSQHRALGNQDPPVEAEEALVELFEELADGAVAVDEGALERRPPVEARGDAEHAACFHASWRRILPPAYARPGLDGLRAMVVGLVEARRPAA